MTAAVAHPRRLIAVTAASLVSAVALAQSGAPVDTSEWTTQDDHRHMLQQLGITRLRPGPNADADAPNAANYDEALANPFPDLPDVLTMNDGRPVTSAQMWYEERRPEIVEAFEREVVGRVPDDVPQIEWTVIERAEGEVGGLPVVGKRLIGRADNSRYPAIEVEIEMTLVTPKNAAGPVPVMMMFGGARSIPGGEPPPPSRFGNFTPPPGSDPPATEQLIAAGWGYSQLNPSSVQADNGAGLTKGIIGLTNRGQPRQPDDWGALRAWAWGAARGLDYLETDPTADATRVGIEGVSRYGKAALVTLAFEPRFAVALVASSGEGGVKLHRRNFGEAVENLTGSGQYHWMAGNFLKYGAAEAGFGSMNAGDLPVDSHMLLALCAPRATFISYGIPERGDAHWLDQRGSFMAAVAAGPVFRLLGVKDLGTSDDYMAEPMPAVNEGLLDGHLAWRQHDGGHTSGPSWKHFIPWASELLGLPAESGYRDEPRSPSATIPVERTDANSRIAHRQLIEKARSGRIDVYFAGDSITRRWGATDYPHLLEHWRETFHGWNAANFAWGGDSTEHMLWRLQNGELDGLEPKVFVLLAGTNNVGAALERGLEVDTAGIAAGVEALVREMRRRVPTAGIVLTAIFPRNDHAAARPAIAQINAQLERFAAREGLHYVDINNRLADEAGRLRTAFSDDGLHLNAAGYAVWAEALVPRLTDLLGPPAESDEAPPPTGDPSASMTHHVHEESHS